TSSAGGVVSFEHGGGGAETRIICGKFALDHEGSDALLALLPRLLHVPGHGTDLAPWVDTTLRLLDREIDGASPGADVLLTRLTDVFFVQVLRRHLERSGAGGWLAAASDPHVGRALAMVHDDPSGPWTASELGARVGL